MISKERLEELIEKEATIYSARIKVREIPLNDLIQIYTEHGEDVIVFGYDPNDWEDLKDCYETKEQAQWYSKYHTTRTEVLDLPMWEDVKDKHYFKRFCVKNNVYTLYVGNFGEDLLEKDTIQILGNKHFNGRNVLIGTIFEKPKNKLNYLRACDLCLKLFEGEENGN